MNLAEHVLRAGLSHPDKLALSVVGLSRADRWSHGRLRQAVLGTATGLRRHGLVQGDRLLIRMGNTPAFPVVYLAAIAAGVVPVPSSAMLTAAEITALSRLIGPAAIAADGTAPLPTDSPAQVLSLQELTAWRDLPPAEFVQGDPERMAYIVFTSGSGGTPRPVCHAHRAILARQMMFQGWYGLTAQDRVMHAGAFNWTFTLGTGLLDPWTMGASALIPEPSVGPEQLPLLAARHGASILAAAPGVFRRMLRAQWRPWPELRHGLTAGERLDPGLRTAWQDRTGTDLHEAMGMTECSTFVSGSPERPAPPGTAGFAQPGRKVQILDPSGKPTDGIGTLAVHRSDPGLFLGYLDQPDETAARFAGDWFLTGDLAQDDGSGAIRILGRRDDMMNAGGFRVAPPEVEEALADVPQAGDLAATELPVAAGTSIIALFWTGAASEDALRSQAAQRLARYKQPRAYIHLDALPRTATGKINRRALRALYRKDIP
ncbi:MULTISPECIES: class I adenylate-forming enzyme family protein [unclassified Paracoccus (in: a-proteobacteria)]|uniref:class I adenylate-forming enzyme family protein n=1 Tax=unclassified Paracoccus (in: a-proteobacteria) TaxID=2688777 RepID=UPI0012B3D1C1|nr:MULTISPECIES: class I adenylate-forming enzyme family protein [unclassified Paracoccus (in: a-proteobacteria)]UXU74116.1 acyl--CoA ligase [Paracoccus sp. SMMA_5]UXU80005.1 acyl--CoA ligase [Paracoccus sp. SMMA_5_TC]